MATYEELFGGGGPGIRVEEVKKRVAPPTKEALRPPPPPVVDAPPAELIEILDEAPSSLLMELRDLVANHDAGLITDGEFLAARARLLARQ